MLIQSLIIIVFYFLLQLEALDYATKLLEKYLPGVKVFPAVGNHESAPVNRYIFETSFVAITIAKTKMPVMFKCPSCSEECLISTSLSCMS